MADLHHGPLNKSLYTQQLELVVKLMLYSQNKITFQYKNHNEGPQDLHANLDGIDVNLSRLFSKANFYHLELAPRDSEIFIDNMGIYDALLQLFHGKMPYFNYHREAPALTEAEKLAILDYSGFRYAAINDLLYKKRGELLNFGDSTKHNIIKTILISSGLNKILPKAEHHQVKSYRGERHTPKAEIDKRIQLVKQGGGCTEQPAFMSTSTLQSVANGFKGNGNCLIIFDSVYGKSIERLSEFSSEKEYLLPPGQIYWKTYELKNGSHVFHADAVAPLIHDNDSPNDQDIAKFNALLDLAIKKGIPLSFLTSHLKEHILKREIPADPIVPAIVPKKRKLRIVQGLACIALLALGIALVGGLFPAILSSYNVSFLNIAAWISIGIFTINIAFKMMEKISKVFTKAIEAIKQLLAPTVTPQPGVVATPVNAQLEILQPNPEKPLLLQYPQKREDGAANCQKEVLKEVSLEKANRSALAV